MAGLPPEIPGTEPTFLQSDAALARVARPIARFLSVEAAGGVVLLAAAVVALVWANSPWQASYTSFWATELELKVGPFLFQEDLAHWVNDALMAVFFFVVGLEIKREVVTGELRDHRAIALPALAALGGMVVPAAIYFVLNAGTVGADGWGIPMATDIAFALGVVAILGSRVPAALKVFLLSLAIVDDIGAIVVIAVFYTDDLAPQYLLLAAGLVAAVITMRRSRVVYPPLYLAAAAALWLAVYESGVHATIAGVVMGLLAPARPFQSELDAQAVVDHLENRAELSVDDVRATARAITQSVSVCDRLIELLHPWTSYVVIPIFALANAGIALSGDAFASPSAVLVGVILGLVVGKLVGVTAFAWLAVRLRLGSLPEGVTWRQFTSVAAVAGIGFTVSLFITDLAFADMGLETDAKSGILVGSVTAALLGSAVVIRGNRRAACSQPRATRGRARSTMVRLSIRSQPPEDRRVLQRIESPTSVLVFRAVGKVERSDYDTELEPAVEAMIAEQGEVRFVYVLGDDFDSYTAGATWEDAKLGVAHASKWKRIAVVTNHDGVRHAVGMLGWMVSGDVRVFPLAEEAKAIGWAAG